MKSRILSKGRSLSERSETKGQEPRSETKGTNGSKGRRLAAAVLAAALSVGLAACTQDPLATQYREGSNKGYIAGDFKVVEIPADQRTAPIEFSGKTDSGGTLGSADLAGQVVVVNFWYAACGPCIVEAPRLEKASGEFTGQPVAFVGVNVYDQPATARSFATDNGVTYPSLIAIDDKDLKLAFAAATPLQAVPTTLVLDREGRVAARIVGELPDASVLTALVRDAVAEPA